MEYCYEYPRPMVTTDVILVSSQGGETRILLILRAKDPYSGKWALPGGFIDMEETCLDAARRELREETGLSFSDLHQFKAYDDPQRDPRGRTITIVYFGVIDEAVPDVMGQDDASEASWFSRDDLPPFAFDHALIISDFLHAFDTGIISMG